MEAETQAFQQIFEASARAIRRGDATRMQEIASRVAELWKAFSVRDDMGQLDEFRGSITAVQSILGFALARATEDARMDFVGRRKAAIPILHKLAKAERENGAGNRFQGISVTEVSQAVGIWPQNSGDLLKGMVEIGLITSTTRGPAKLLKITSEGVAVLEAVKPGWQTEERWIPVPQGPENTSWPASLVYERSTQQLRDLRDSLLESLRSNFSYRHSDFEPDADVYATGGRTIGDKYVEFFSHHLHAVDVDLAGRVAERPSKHSGFVMSRTDLPATKQHRSMTKVKLAKHEGAVAMQFTRRAVK